MNCSTFVPIACHLNLESLYLCAFRQVSYPGSDLRIPLNHHPPRSQAQTTSAPPFHRSASQLEQAARAAKKGTPTIYHSQQIHHNGQERYTASIPFRVTSSIAVRMSWLTQTQQHSKIPHHRRPPHLHGLDRLLQDARATSSTQTVEYA